LKEPLELKLLAGFQTGIAKVNLLAGSLFAVFFVRDRLSPENTKNNHRKEWSNVCVCVYKLSGSCRFITENVAVSRRNYKNVSQNSISLLHRFS